MSRTERTYARTYGRTDGRTFETGFIRSTLSKSRPKMHWLLLLLLLLLCFSSSSFHTQRSRSLSCCCSCWPIVNKGGTSISFNPAVELSAKIFNAS